MSLSAWEQQALNSIEERLVRSDPQLATLLVSFTRLVSHEEMPVREDIRASSWRAIRDPWHRRRRGRRAKSRRHLPLTPQRAGFQRGVLLVYLLVMIVLIAVGITVGLGGGSGGCPSAWAVPCGSSTHAHSPRPGAHERVASQTANPDGPHPAPG